MKASDYIVSFMEGEGVDRVFLVAGGGIMHIMDSLDKSPKIQYICNHHEQACAMAAEGYQRVRGGIGVAISTTGPGGTNMITGTIGSWMDSIPMLFISGQSNSSSLIGNTGLRQKGVHEADIVSLIKPITKYAVIVIEVSELRYHLEKAVYLAKNGRPGPVWLDIPIDVQAKEIEPSKLHGFDPQVEFPRGFLFSGAAEANAKKVAELLACAKRPLFVCGHGIRLSRAIDDFGKFLEKAQVPVVCAKNAYDIVEYSNPLFLGMAGINGVRSANFAVQSCDLIISFGSRLALPFTGYNSGSFAPLAKHIVVDVDEKQLQHSNIRIDLPVQCDVGNFMRELSLLIPQGGWVRPAWIARCSHWKKDYPTMLSKYGEQKKFIDAYYFVDVLFEHLGSDVVVVLDQGAAFYCPTQAGKMKKGQRMFTNGGISPMGYGLPAAIGACFGNGCKDVICLHGDGGLQLNIQELQTIVYHHLPIKLFVFNNNGYVSIKHTMQNYFGKMVACDPQSGLSCPDTGKIAAAYGIPHERMASLSELREKMPRVLSTHGPIVIEVMIDPMQPIVPKVQSERLPDGRMVSKPLDDMYPYLSRAEYEKEKSFPENE